MTDTLIDSPAWKALGAHHAAVRDLHLRELFESAGAPHELHYIEASDELCKRQLRERSRHLPPGTRWTTDAEFDMIMAHFDPPGEDEGFHVIRHER